MVNLVVDEVTPSELRGHLWSEEDAAGSGRYQVIGLDDVIRVRDWL